MQSQSLLLRCIVGLFRRSSVRGQLMTYFWHYILLVRWRQKFCDVVTNFDVVTIVLELTSYYLPITNYIKSARGSSIQLLIIMSSTWCGSTLQVPDSTNYEQTMIVIHDIWFIFCSFIVCCVLFWWLLFLFLSTHVWFSLENSLLNSHYDL